MDSEMWRRREQRILEFCEGNELERTVHRRDGVNIWVIHDSGTRQLPSKLLEYYTLVEKRLNDPPNNYEKLCTTVAHDLYNDAGYGAVMRGTGCDTNFSGFVTHAINSDSIEDSKEPTFFAIDHTARYNVGQWQGELDLLIVRAQSEEELIDRLGQLYGGVWTKEPQVQKGDPIYRRDEDSRARVEALLNL